LNSQDVVETAPAMSRHKSAEVPRARLKFPELGQYSDIVDVPRIFGTVGHQNTSVVDELIFSQ
jgi:hypothetical protein